jgi:NCAIR mutase (PurE)-related protein
MDRTTIIDKINLLKENKLSQEEFLKFIEHLPYHKLNDLKLDFHRRLRRGVPEAIFGEGKSISQLKSIISKFSEMQEELIVTRIKENIFGELNRDFSFLKYHKKARVITFDKKPKIRTTHPILVLSAGAADERVSEEAFICSQFLGNKVDKNYDLGVSCLYRILDIKEQLNDYSVIIIVAGMEGALASVVSGLTSTPIIAVPSSVGYGANLNGLSTLLSMLNSCSGGISVVNIDNGFGAAYLATLINRKIGLINNQKN